MISFLLQYFAVAVRFLFLASTFFGVNFYANAKRKCTGFFCMDDNFFNHLGPFFDTTPNTPLEKEDKTYEEILPNSINTPHSVRFSLVFLGFQLLIKTAKILQFSFEFRALFERVNSWKFVCKQSWKMAGNSNFVMKFLVLKSSKIVIFELCVV